MDYRHIIGSMVLAAAATGAAFAPSAHAYDRRIVADGETLQWPHAYTYYRFVVKDRDAAVSGNEERLRIAELALYDADGNRLNAGLTLAAAEDKATTNLLAGTFAVYGPHTQYDGRGFDDDVSTYFNAWVQPTASSWAWLYFTMRLSAEAKPVASYNVAFSTTNNVRSWALQASDDHTTWFTLDEKNASEVAATAPSDAGWCNGGTPIAVTDESAHFFVERGGTLTITDDATPASVHSYGGAVSVAAGATLGRDVASGESEDFTGGGLSGSGTFEKTGAGSLAVSGVNSGFAGTVKASGGTLAFRPIHVTPKFTYYRFVVKDRNTSAQRLRIAEIALFDADGVRLNAKLSAAASQETTTTNLLPGTYAVYGQQTEYESFGKAFDDDLSTSFNCWLQSSNSEWAWLYFTMRLASDNDVAPASYDVAFASENNIQSWALQGSDDHTTWFTLDERDATAVAAIAPSGAGWCNGGTPLPLTWDGSNAPVGEVDAKWFRFTVKAVDTTDGTRCLAEFSLYDLQGKRVNIGLSDLGYNASSLTAGSWSRKSKASGTLNGNGSMFDEDPATFFSGYDFQGPTLTDATTWMTYTMRLADDAPPVASYNFMPRYLSAMGSATDIGRAPHDWLVEASKDGTTWFEVDSRSGEDAAALLPTTAKTYCNGGHPIGFTSGCDRWLAPTGAVMEVSNGATLSLPTSGANSVAGLAIDLTTSGNAGTIANFTPAASGTLYLTSAQRHPQLDDAAMPVTFTGISNASNVEGWSVAVNGVPAEEGEYSLRFDANSVLRVTRKVDATVLYLR